MTGYSRRSILGSAAAIGAVTVAGGASAQQGSSATPQPASGTTAAPYQATSVNQRLPIINLDLLEQDAKERLAPFPYAFIAGGAGDELSVRSNRESFKKYPIMSTRLTGVGEGDVRTETTLLGTDMAHPIIVAPMGAHGVLHRDAEAATAAGAGLAGALYQSSAASNLPMEAIAAATTGPKWFQIYFNSDQGVNQSILERAKAAGFTAIVLTVDAAGPGGSDRTRLLGQRIPDNLRFGNYDASFGGRGNFREQKDGLTLADIEFCRRASGLPVVVKGILRPEDALRAIDAGASAIQVSNHGGRQIDGLISSIDALPPVADAVAGRVPLIMDGGLRRGHEVFQALACGADAVAIGRPILYGLGLGGAGGVQSVIEFLVAELTATMVLTGKRTIADIDRASVVPM